MLFDEYVAKSRGKYKGGEYGIHEPAIFFRLMETIFRRREFWIIMLGNNDTLTNPYNEQLNIPFTTRYYKNRNRDLFYYFDTSEDTVKEKQDSILGKLSKNTEYENYTTQISLWTVLTRVLFLIDLYTQQWFIISNIYQLK